MTRPLRILTWHVHGNYLWYLSHVAHEIVLPVKPWRPHGYGGRAGTFPWPDTVREVPVDRLADEQIDAVVYQAHDHWLVDRHEVLSPAQRAVPQIVVEHDPPRQSPTDTRHPVDDPDALIVHVTAFNDLMWDCGRTPTTVVEHGVVVPDRARYTGELARGITVVNGLAQRGRRLGLDVFLSTWWVCGRRTSVGGARSRRRTWRLPWPRTASTSTRCATRASGCRCARR
jgi:hypothetical protein